MTSRLRGVPVLGGLLLALATLAAAIWFWGAYVPVDLNPRARVDRGQQNPDRSLEDVSSSIPEVDPGVVRAEREALGVPDVSNEPTPRPAVITLLGTLERSRALRNWNHIVVAEVASANGSVETHDLGPFQFPGEHRLQFVGRRLKLTSHTLWEHPVELQLDRDHVIVIGDESGGSPRRVGVRVLDADYQPVPDVELRVLRSNTLFIAEAAACADSAGRIDIPQGRGLSFVCYSPRLGFAARAQVSREEFPTQTVVIPDHTSCRLTVHVPWASADVPGFVDAVQISSQNGPALDFRVRAPLSSQFKAEFGKLPWGQYRLEYGTNPVANSPRSESHITLASDEALVEMGQMDCVALTVEVAHRSPEWGGPVWARLQPENPAVASQAVPMISDAVRFGRVLPGTYTLLIVSPNIACSRLVVVEAIPVEQRVQIQVEESPIEVRGIVIGARSFDDSEVVIRWQATLNESVWHSQAAVDEHGHFEFRARRGFGQLPRPAVLVAVRSKDGVILGSASIGHETTEVQLEASAPPRGRLIRLRVVDGDGREWRGGPLRVSLSSPGQLLDRSWIQSPTSGAVQLEDRLYEAALAYCWSLDGRLRSDFVEVQAGHGDLDLTEPARMWAHGAALLVADPHVKRLSLEVRHQESAAVYSSSAQGHTLVLKPMKQGRWVGRCRLDGTSQPLSFEIDGGDLETLLDLRVR